MTEASQQEQLRFNFRAPAEIGRRFRARAWLEGLELSDLVVHHWMAEYGEGLSDEDMAAYEAHEAREAAKLARRKARREGGRDDEAEAG